MFVKIFQVSVDEQMRKYLGNLDEFSTQKLFQIRACVISARKAKHLDVTAIFYILSCKQTSRPNRTMARPRSLSLSLCVQKNTIAAHGITELASISFSLSEM